MLFKSKRKTIFLIAAVLWMTVIFLFSSRNGDTSAQDSGRIGRLVGEIFVPGFKDWDADRQTVFAGTVDHPIRKAAHASEYAVLGILIFGVVYERRKSRVRCLFLPWLLGTAYAATDELHQLLVPGRSGQVSDVVIDSAGVLAGVLVISVLSLAVTNRKKE